MKLLKVVAIAILACALQTSINAQETPTGKKLAEDFWKFMDEGRIVAAEGRLASLKRREPKFDVSKMEKALVDTKAKNDGIRAESRNSLMTKVHASNSLNSLFRSRNIQADSSDTLESINSEIDKYSKMADEVIAAGRDSLATELERILPGLKGETKSDAQVTEKLIKRSNDSTTSTGAETAYYELLLRQSYWDTSRRIFPDDADILKSYNAVTAAVKSLGTPEQRAAQAEKNLNAKIDAERLPKAGQRNPNLEKQIQDIFNKINQNKNFNYTFLKSVIISPDYGIVRHDLTGIILKRYVLGAVALKTKEGKCKQGLFRIEQNYVGGSFSGVWFGDFAGLTNEMRCENVNK